MQTVAVHKMSPPRNTFSDESYIRLQEGFNKQNTRIIAATPEEANSYGRLVERSPFPKTLMVWGGICWNGKTPLVIFEPGENVNANNYKAKVLLPLKYRWTPALFKNAHWTFQQDSASAHAANPTQAWCMDNVPGFITKDEWRANFPQGNPVDYCVWPILKEKVCATHHGNLNGWKWAMRREWNKFDLSTLRKSIVQFPKRLKACIKANGGQFEED